MMEKSTRLPYVAIESAGRLVQQLRCRASLDDQSEQDPARQYMRFMAASASAWLNRF